MKETMMEEIIHTEFWWGNFLENSNFQGSRDGMIKWMDLRERDCEDER
jgi:hypothetical protein